METKNILMIEFSGLDLKWKQTKIRQWKQTKNRQWKQTKIRTKICQWKQTKNRQWKQTKIRYRFNCSFLRLCWWASNSGRSKKLMQRCFKITIKKRFSRPTARIRATEWQESVPLRDKTQGSLIERTCGGGTGALEKKRVIIMCVQQKVGLEGQRSSKVLL
jgi:hypothetical protein